MKVHQQKRKWLAAAIISLTCNISIAGLMTVTWSDVANDQSPVGDVIKAKLSFDDAGNWTAYWWADPAHPFTGNARFNLNLFDTSLGVLVGATAPQVNLDGFMNFGASTANEFSYTGFTPYLHNWKVGDIISTGNFTNFYSGIVNQDRPFGRDILLTAAPVVGSAPEPSTVAMSIAGLLLMGVVTSGRRNKQH